MTNQRVIWGSINVEFTENWYMTCLRSMSKCHRLPDIAVVLEIDPINQDIKNQLQHHPISWFFVTHGLVKIDNINNDNARNLRYLIPKMVQIAGPDDIIALIEQDVMIHKKDWIDESIKLLDQYKMVCAAGAYGGTEEATRRNRPKPYFTVFRAKDAIEINDAIKTNRGSFVTINIDDSLIYRLDKHKRGVFKAHTFGTNAEPWATHARGGSNYDGVAEKSIVYFNRKRNHRDTIEW